MQINLALSPAYFAMPKAVLENIETFEPCMEYFLSAFGPCLEFLEGLCLLRPGDSNVCRFSSVTTIANTSFTFRHLEIQSLFIPLIILALFSLL